MELKSLHNGAIVQNEAFALHCQANRLYREEVFMEAVQVIKIESQEGLVLQHSRLNRCKQELAVGDQALILSVQLVERAPHIFICEIKTGNESFQRFDLLSHFVLVELPRVVPVDGLEGAHAIHESLFVHVDKEHAHHGLLEPCHLRYVLQSDECLSDLSFLILCIVLLEFSDPWMSQSLFTG